MIKTHIYLTEEEHSALGKLSVRNGKKQSELIRQAVDEFLAGFDLERRQAVIDCVAGMWKDRTDLPDFAQIRQSLDRGISS